MTTTTTSAPTTEEPRSESWESIAVGFAFEIAHPNFDRGDLAALRRMNLGRFDAQTIPPTLWRLLARRGLLTDSVVVERKWALIIHGIALMTKTNGDSVAVRAAHDNAVPVGRVLFEGGYSPSRFSRLMTARGGIFSALLSRMFRMMASGGHTFNWYQMAQLILAEDYDEAQADRMRRIIARDYYWAEDRAGRQSS